MTERLSGMGYKVVATSDAEGVGRRLREEVPDLVLVDADETEDGLLDLVAELRGRFEFLPLVVLTSKGDASLVAEGMRRGAFDFMSKPVEHDRLDFSLKSAAHLHRLMLKVNRLQAEYRRRGQFQGIVGISPPMQAIFSTIESVGSTNVTVFVIGDSGTGKELIAKAIHKQSSRVNREFVAINCAAIPRELLESELFGHEKGAFTGAVRRYCGCVEQADGGTLFLDEIAEMDIELQSKLLRFLQERAFYRLGGGTREIAVDVRVVAATNRDPEGEVRAGRLREDLYYRLAVVPILVPPLRDRKEDVPPLAEHFLERYSAKYGKYFYDFAPEAMQALIEHEWPGNVRELENLIERIVVLNSGSQVTEQMLPPAMLTSRPGRRVPDSGNARIIGAGDTILPMRELERRAIARALDICDGNVARASRELELGQATLYRKIKKYGLVTNGGRV
jgi:two-component system repressor protein LuxO